MLWLPSRDLSAWVGADRLASYDFGAHDVPRLSSLRSFGARRGEDRVDPFEFYISYSRPRPPFWWGPGTEELRERPVRERHAEKGLATGAEWELGARELENILLKLDADAKRAGAQRRRHIQEGFRSWPVPMPRSPR